MMALALTPSAQVARPAVARPPARQVRSRAAQVAGVPLRQVGARLGHHAPCFRAPNAAWGAPALLQAARMPAGRAPAHGLARRRGRRRRSCAPAARPLDCCAPRASAAACLQARALRAAPLRSAKRSEIDLSDEYAAVDSLASHVRAHLGSWRVQRWRASWCRQRANWPRKAPPAGLPATTPHATPRAAPQDDVLLYMNHQHEAKNNRLVDVMQVRFWSAAPAAGRLSRA